MFLEELQGGVVRRVMRQDEEDFSNYDQLAIKRFIEPNLDEKKLDTRIEQQEIQSSKMSVSSLTRQDQTRLEHCSSSLTKVSRSVSKLFRLCPGECYDIWSEERLDVKLRKESKHGQNETFTPGASYRIRNGPTFFQPGRVFAVVWHEPVTETLRKARAKARAKGSLFTCCSRNKADLDSYYEEQVYSSVHIMIVIRNKKGYCWCVPAHRSRSRRAAGKGAIKMDPDACTILYGAKKQPYYPRKQSGKTKSPIAVNLVENVTLSRNRRIHLGSTLAVNWDLKVKDVGTIAENDLEVLKSYVQHETFGGY